MSTLKIIDVSRFQGPDPNFDGYDGVIINITPQNPYRDVQIAKAYREGKVVGYYVWPLAFAGDWGTDAREAATYINGLVSQYGDWARGPVFQDFESGSFSGDPVGPGLAWIQTMHACGYGAHDYVQYSLIRQFDWSSHAAAGAALWFAEYTSNPDTAFGPWPYATGWQDSDRATNGGGGDDSIFYCSAAAFHALSYPPNAAPQAATVTPIGGFLMALTDAEQQELLKIARYLEAPEFKRDFFTGASDMEKAARAQFIADIFNFQVPWHGFDGNVPATGRTTTTLGLDLGYNDARFAGVVNLVKALQSNEPAQIAKAVIGLLPTQPHVDAQAVVSEIGKLLATAAPN